ncbi:MAG: 6-carboxytetrahydropterin synthase [Chthoniobacterales bacterium]|nr:6-carboxytetrahydropterin synthase [Chthoniobacterales bacterium]
MPFRICKSFEIESGHMLAHHPDKCRFPHGHSRRIEIILEADELDQNGMVCDFKAIKIAAEQLLETFDHALCVNTDDPTFPQLQSLFGCRIIPFPSTEPTTEILAKFFYEQISSRLQELAAQPDPRYPVRPSIRLLRVRVWETSDSWAEYEPVLTPPSKETLQT